MSSTGDKRLGPFVKGLLLHEGDLRNPDGSRATTDEEIGTAVTAQALRDSALLDPYPELSERLRALDYAYVHEAAQQMVRIATFEQYLWRLVADGTSFASGAE